MMRNITTPKIVTAAAICLLSIGLYARLHGFAAIQFDSDFGRDSLFAMRILQGKPTLLGPQASVGGFYLGPIYFYALALLYAVFGFTPAVASVSFILMGVATMAIGYILQKKYVSKLSGLVFLCLTATNFVLIYASRSVTNQPMMPFVTLLVVWSLMRALKKNTIRSYVLSGLVFGLFFHVHFSALMLFPGYVLAILLLSKTSIHQRIMRMVAAGVGMAVMLSPLLAFDLKHHFLLLSAFVEYALKTLHGDVIASNLHQVTIWDKLGFLYASISTQTYLALLIVLGSALGLYLARRRMVGESKTYTQTLALLFLPAIVLFFAYRGYVFSYYLLTVSTVGLLFFSTALAYVRPRVLPALIGVAVLITGVASSSVLIPYRTISNLARVTQVIEHNVDATKPQSFTIFKDSSDQLTGLGYEYRFLLARDHYVVVDENTYASAQVLYVIREEGETDPLILGHWEVSQFAPTHAERIAIVEFPELKKNVEVFRLTRK